MSIKVYPSLLPGLPIEVHNAGGMTIGGWLLSNGADYRSDEVPRVQIELNGRFIAMSLWAETEFCESDAVDIRILPHGGVFNGLGSIISKVFDLAFGWLLPRNKTPGSGSTEQGQRLEPSRATANQVRLGEVVPELAGRHRVYPYYLNQPRRYFVNQREQWLEFLCCIGPGSYQISDSDVKIGDTAFSALGADASYSIFAPGSYVGGTSAHENWYAVDEVGGTSSGTAGLEMSSIFSADLSPNIPSYLVDGSSLIAVGGVFPEAWGVGTMLTINIFRSYEVTQISSGGPEPTYYNKYTGNFREIAPAPNKLIRRAFLGSDQYYRIGDFEVDENGDGWISLLNPFTGDPISGPPFGAQSMQFFIFNRKYRITDVLSNTEILLTGSDSGVDVPGWPGFAPYAGPIDIAADGGSVYGEWSSVFRVLPAGELTNTIELDFFFPSGLAYVENDGSLSSHNVSVQVNYRDAAVGGAFSSVTYNYSERTLDQIGFTERITTGSLIAPEVRVRRVGAQDTSTQVNDTIQWYGLRSRLATRTSYPGWTTMSVKVRSGGRLGAQSENQINVIGTRILPVLGLDGEWQSPQPTRDISAFFRYIATTIGYTDDSLDMDEIRRLHAIWSGRGETIDYVFDETTVKGAIDLSLAAGMSEMTISYGQIRPVRDDVRTQFEQAYSPQNMKEPLRRLFRSKRVDDTDGVEVEFINGDTWTPATIKCLLPGDAGFKLEKISLKGVLDRTRAWRIGMRRRRELRYRKWDYSFSTEMDALNSRYLSYVPLIGSDPGYGQSAILTGIEASGPLALLRVSEPMKWEDGQDYVVAYRKTDGTLAGPFSAQRGDDDFQIIADIPLPWPIVTLRQEPPHVYFGTIERWSFPALITAISPSGLESVPVTAVNYDVRVYASDNEPAPA